MRATYVDRVPDPKKGVGRRRAEARKEWIAAAEKAVASPGSAVFLGHAIRRSRIVSARQIVAQFNATLPQGRVEVSQREQVRGEDGELYADLYFEYVGDED